MDFAIGSILFEANNFFTHVSRVSAVSNVLYHCMLLVIVEIDRGRVKRFAAITDSL
jgi:hypothetical protein